MGLDECISAFTRLGLEGFLPTIQHWVQATHAARMASRRRHRQQLLKQAQAAAGAGSTAVSEVAEHEGEGGEEVDDEGVDEEELEGED